MSDLDAKPCVADLDARGFCRGYTDPLAMMGVALDRYLPGRNAMLANETYVFLLRTAFAMIAATTPEAMMTTISTGASTIPGIPAKKNPSPKR